MFPKYSRKKELRVRLPGLCLCTQRERATFYFLSPARGISARNGTGCSTAFLSAVLFFKRGDH